MDSDRIIKTSSSYLKAASIKSVTNYCDSSDNFVYRYYRQNIKVFTKSKKNYESCDPDQAPS